MLQYLWCEEMKAKRTLVSRAGGEEGTGMKDSVKRAPHWRVCCMAGFGERESSEA